LDFNSEVDGKESLKVEVIRKIFTLNDFEVYEKDKSSAVSKLSKEAIIEFKKGMEFRDGIIITAKYTIVKKELSAKDNEAFWLLFGISKMELKNSYNLKCISPFQCQIATDYICIGC